MLEQANEMIIVYIQTCEFQIKCSVGNISVKNKHHLKVKLSLLQILSSLKRVVSIFNLRVTSWCQTSTEQNICCI